MAFRRITAYVVPLGLMIIAFVGFAALSTSGQAAAPATVDNVVSDRLEARSRVAAAVFASRFEAAAGVQAAVTSETQAAAPTTSEAVAEVGADEPKQEDGEKPAAAAAVSASSSDDTPPVFKVEYPKDGAEVEDRVVRFRGTVEMPADVYSGRFFATVSDDGEWELPLLVIPGANVASITALDDAGNETSIRLIVNYNPPEPTSTTKAEKKKSTTTTKAPAKKKATTTKAPAKEKATTTTTKEPATTTTEAPSSQWSPKWPASSGGRRDIEKWRSLVADYWPADRVDCALGIIHRESRGDPRARNTKHDTRGLFQHLVKYWKGRAAGAGFIDSDGLVANPYNAEANIAAAAYLADYYDRIGKNWWSPWGGLPSYGSCGE